MGRNKHTKNSKKAANAASRATSDPALAAKQIVPSDSANGHVRLSKSNETAAATATPPYSSDGPTLPIIEGLPTSNEAPAAKLGEPHAKNGIFKKPEISPASGVKRNVDEGIPESFQQPESEASDRSKRARVQNDEQRVSVSDGSRPPHSPRSVLSTPWLLLPAPLLASIYSRSASQTFFENHCVPMVIGRNTNITASVNKVKTYLGFSERGQNSSIPMPDPVQSDSLVIAISAQGEATVKLASIVEVAKRVVSEGQGNRQTWYSYTILSSVVLDELPKQKKEKFNENRNTNGEEDEEEEAFETLVRHENVDLKKRKVPILTIWMSMKQIPEFQRAYGEQTFNVSRAERQG